MGHPRFDRLLSRILSDYGMVLVLLLLGACFSYVTWDEQHPTGVDAAEQLTARITREFSPGAAVLVVAREHREDAAFADSLQRQLDSAGLKVLGTIKGQPSDARDRLLALSRSGAGLDAIACTDVTGRWAVFDRLGEKFPGLAGVQSADAAELPLAQLPQARQLAERGQPDRGHRHSGGGDDHGHHHGGHRPIGGQPDRLLGGDVHLADPRGGLGRSLRPLDMVLCCLGAILVCGLLGAFSGVMVTWFAIPPFIATLGMMLVASGLAYILAEGQSVYQVPDSFVWLAAGTIC